MTSQSETQSPSQGSSLIQSIYVQPDIRRNRITIHIETLSPCTLHIAIPELRVEIDTVAGRNFIPLDGYTIWAPESPKTYELVATAKSSDGKTDAHTLHFGMREFTIKENRFFFNNRPLYIKGIDGTALQAKTTLSEADCGSVESSLKSLLDAQFNLIRIGISPATTDILSITDALGLLVEVEITKAGDLDYVDQLKNHPSLVCWNILALQDPNMAALQEKDPSRLYLYTDSASGEPHCGRPYRDDHQRIDMLTVAHQPPAIRRSQSYCQHMGEPSTLSYIAQLKIGLLDFDATAAQNLDQQLQARELNKIVPTSVELAEQVKSISIENVSILLDSIRSNGNLSGYCLSATSAYRDAKKSIADASQDLLVFTALKKHQTATRPLISISQNNLVPRKETPVKVFLLNEDKLEGRADLSLQVVGPTNQVLWKKKRGVRLPKSGKLLWEGEIAASGSTGKHRFVVRVMMNMQCIAESSADFFVYPPAERWDGTVNLLDPDRRWASDVLAKVTAIEFKSPMHIIPPITNSIRAYPDNDLAQILGQVNEGAVALFFQPPEDWNDFARHIDTELLATQEPANSVDPAQVHYAKSHPVFDSLPSRSIMGATYGQLIPATTFLEESEEDICGCIRSAGYDSDAIVGSNILVKKYGSGRIVFISLTIMERLGQNPAADHLFVNLLKHFARRSVPSQSGSFAVHQRSVEWIRNQRNDFTQNWAIIGMFPYSPDAAKAPVYPPENTIDLTATYPGWYRALSWKHWFSKRNDKFVMNLDSALGPEFVEGPTSDYGIAYAYAEVIGETRGEMRLVLDRKTRMEVYINNALVYSPESDENEPNVYIKLGKNTILVKIFKTPGAFRFKLDFEALSTPVKYRWWK